MNDEYVEQLLPAPPPALVERAQRVFWDYIIWGVLKALDWARPEWRLEMKQGIGDFLRIAFIAVVLAALVMIALPHVVTFIKYAFSLAISLASILWSLATYFAKFILFLLLFAAFVLGLWVWRAHPSVTFMTNFVRLVGQMFGV